MTITDDQLAERELWFKQYHGAKVSEEIGVALIREVRRLRESAYYLSGRALITEAEVRAEKAETEVERLRTEASSAREARRRAERAEAERDRYRGILEAAYFLPEIRDALAAIDRETT